MRCYEIWSKNLTVKQSRWIEEVQYAKLGASVRIRDYTKVYHGKQ